MRASKKCKIRFEMLMRNPFFWILTVIGNLIILLGGLLFYTIESKSGAQQADFLDCLLLSAGTVTTIGYGNFTPMTDLGKITLLILMLVGTLFVWSYMGFVVTGLIAPEIAMLEKDVHDLERDIKLLKSESKN